MVKKNNINNLVLVMLFQYHLVSQPDPV